MANSFDIIIIGGGPGGYVSAIRAAQLGLKVGLVEEAELGGICLNWGCIPTKALLHTAEVMDEIRHAGDLGIKVGKPSFDLDAVILRSRAVSQQLNRGVTMLLKKNKVVVFEGRAELLGAGKGGHRVAVRKKDKGDEEIFGKHIIIATGARARELPDVAVDGKRVWSYRHALQPPHMPKKLIVLGSGAIGIEFASFYSAMGADVTVIEILDRILPVEDSEISSLAHKAFVAKGMSIMAGVKLAGVEVNGKGVALTLEGGERIGGDTLIVAIGIVGNVENMGLEAYSSIKTAKTHIEVNEWAETGESGIYAIGDVAGAPWLAHKAEHEGVIAVERIAGVSGLHPLDKSKIAGCTYCSPQIASVGLSEEKAKADGRKIKVGRFPFIGNGKAIALGAAEGLIKTIFDADSGELLGAHMIGAQVTELIQGYVIAQNLETTEAELIHSIFPHPTLSEMMHESVLSAYGRAIHI